MLATVNSSATIALHPEVPNLIPDSNTIFISLLHLDRARPAAMSILPYSAPLGKPPQRRNREAEEKALRGGGFGINWF